MSGILKSTWNWPASSSAYVITSSSAEQCDQHSGSENPTIQELELLELYFIIFLKI